MFESLNERLSKATHKLRGVGRLTDDNIADTLRQIRMALLEADVALPVIKEFTAAVRERALGQEVTKSLTPGQALIKIVHDELVVVMGEESAGLDLRAQPPVVVLLAGLQGAGKTTTAAKLAVWLRERENRKVMLASVDVYRPAAILQLEKVAAQADAKFFKAVEQTAPVEIAKEAVAAARRELSDVLILDTAGRLHVDTEMMDEIRALHAAVVPTETLFVVDSMTGQDAVNAAQAFADALPLTGVVLTKTDGDARGGAALSVRRITGKPIVFLGVGEKLDGLERFHPERVASRILGMGDVLTLVEDVERRVDRDKTEQIAKKLRKGGGFGLLDLKEQLQQMLSLGGIGALLDKLPGVGQLPPGVADQADDRAIRHQIALIDSMTPRERRRPAIINGSRKRRIASGAGRPVQELNRLLKQHSRMQKVMKKMKKGGMQKLLKQLGGPGFRP